CPDREPPGQGVFRLASSHFRTSAMRWPVLIVRGSPHSAPAWLRSLQSSTSATFPERKQRGKVAKDSCMSLGGKESRQSVRSQRLFSSGNIFDASVLRAQNPI